MAKLAKYVKIAEEIKYASTINTNGIAKNAMAEPIVLMIKESRFAENVVAGRIVNTE